MNMARWWVGLTDDDDKQWYRHHKGYKQTTIDWLIDQKGCCYQPHDDPIQDEPEDTPQRNPMEILGPLLENISELDRNVLMLRFGHGLKYREISEKLGYSVSYLWKREQRAMKKLREIISEQD
jgi:RNA polymerase sigma factor (sigma-70 family)